MTLLPPVNGLFVNGAAGFGTRSFTASLGEVVFAKISDPNTAPGAATFKLTAEAGTNSGSCKIVARAGTSATPVVLLDNVGSGC